MHTRRIAVVVGTLAVTGLAVGPAWAKPTFEGDSVAKGTKAKRLELEIPAGKQETVNTRIEIFLPAGFDPQECTATAGWSCSVAQRDPDNPRRPQVTFTRVGCAAESGWRCGRPERASMFVPRRTSAGRPQISNDTNDKNKSDKEETTEGEGIDEFQFVVSVPTKPGTYPFPVIQYRSDPVNAEKIQWNGPADSKYPAPTLTVR